VTSEIVDEDHPPSYELVISIDEPPAYELVISSDEPPAYESHTKIMIEPETHLSRVNFLGIHESVMEI